MCLVRYSLVLRNSTTSLWEAGGFSSAEWATYTFGLQHL